MVDYPLTDRILYHSNKFKSLIEAQSNVDVIPTDDYGWENYRYENPKFRLAHVERYSNKGLQVVHITCFPRKNYKTPIFGFDIIGYQNEDKSKISAAFIDYSPTLYDEKWHNTNWNKDRKLPIWATIFSKDFIAVRPTEDEYEKVFEVGYDVFKVWLDRLNSDVDLVTDTTEIKRIIEKQNTYCTQQASNKRTLGALTASIGRDNALKFMTTVLFPKIKT